MTPREEPTTVNTEEYMMECVKFLRHLEIVGKTFKLKLQPVFSGRIGAVLWTEAITIAAEEEEGRLPKEIHQLRDQIDIIWNASRILEEMPIPVVIRGCEHFTRGGRDAILDAIFARIQKPYHFGRALFDVRLRLKNDANDSATRLTLPNRFKEYLHDSKVLVVDPPILLAHIVHDLCSEHEKTLQRCSTEQREQITLVQRNTDYGTLRAQSIRSDHDHRFHYSINFEALVILFYLYKLMRPHLRRRGLASWTQGPFGFNQSKAEINNSLDDGKRVEIHNWMLQVKDDLHRILGSFRGLEEGQRSHEATYAENLEAVLYFTSFFTRDDSPAARKTHSRSTRVHYPSYPHNPHEAATRSDVLSEQDASSLLY